MRKHYTVDHHHVFDQPVEGQYVLLAQGPDETVPHLTTISGTNLWDLKFIADLLNAAPGVLLDRVRYGKEAA